MATMLYTYHRAFFKIHTDSVSLQHCQAIVTFGKLKYIISRQYSIITVLFVLNSFIKNLLISIYWLRIMLFYSHYTTLYY